MGHLFGFLANTVNFFWGYVMSSGLNMSRRLRRTPYTKNVENLGVSGYSIVNRTLLPKGFKQSIEDDYWHLSAKVQIWDVGCQRQVEIQGSEAEELIQFMTPRKIKNIAVEKHKFSQYLFNKFLLSMNVHKVLFIVLQCLLLPIKIFVFSLFVYR